MTPKNDDMLKEAGIWRDIEDAQIQAEHDDNEEFDKVRSMKPADDGLPDNPEDK